MSAMPGKAGWILPVRFLLFLASFALSAGALALAGLRWGQVVLLGFDVAALAFLVSLVPLGRPHTGRQMRALAQANDANRLGVLVITSLLMLVIVTAVFIDLPVARAAQSPAKGLALALILGSLVIAWVFSNAIYALHYAHMYYRGRAEDGAEGGLAFPSAEGKGKTGSHAPDYWDFAYFAVTIGMAFATSDVEITRPDIRRIVTLHGAVAFFYNLIVLAFTINVTAGG
ncbi:MAG TPA: DUF1345 domain-containing protein [Novosphingobium sp.]|nr:DUF1345 domain-containing protein [Novosphingobium sp.]